MVVRGNVNTARITRHRSYKAMTRVGLSKEGVVTEEVGVRGLVDEKSIFIFSFLRLIPQHREQNGKKEQKQQNKWSEGRGRVLTCRHHRSETFQTVTHARWGKYEWKEGINHFFGLSQNIDLKLFSYQKKSS